MSPAQAEYIKGEADSGAGIDVENADAAEKELLLRVPTQQEKSAIFLIIKRVLKKQQMRRNMHEDHYGYMLQTPSFNF